MPRQKSLLTVIRDLVQQEVRDAMAKVLGSFGSTAKPKRKYRKAKNGRRRKRRASKAD